MKTISSLLDLGGMKYILPVCGIILPGLEQQVWFPKLTMVIYRILPFLTVVFPMSYGVMMMTALVFDVNNGIHETVFYFVCFINVTSVAFRVVIVAIYKDKIKTVAAQINRNFSNPVQSHMRQINTWRKIQILNWIFIINLIIQEFVGLSSQIQSIIVHHQLARPTSVTSEKTLHKVLAIMYYMTTTSAFFFGQAGFEWALLTFVRLTSVEMQVLRQQLNAIFSSLRYDEHTLPVIRKNLLRRSLDDTVGTTSEWQPITDDPVYYTETIRMLDNALNEFVIHHVNTIKLSKAIRKIYGIPIVSTYLYTVVLSTTSMLAVWKPEDNQDTSYLFPIAVIALAILFVESYCGEECVTAGCDVVSDVYGMDWHLFPCRMQKKLVLILMIAQKPRKIDFYGIGPLCMESYSAVLQFCFSLFSFMRTQRQ